MIACGHDNQAAVSFEYYPTLSFKAIVKFLSSLGHARFEILNNVGRHKQNKFVFTSPVFPATQNVFWKRFANIGPSKTNSIGFLMWR